MKKSLIVDITGKKFNHLLVLGLDHCGGRRRTYWKCQCDCGKIVVLRKDSFAYPYSHQKSCGCWHKQESRERMTKNNKTNPDTFYMNQNKRGMK